DFYPPSVEITAPAAGTSFLAGEPITVSVAASDGHGNPVLTFYVDERRLVDDTPPYEATLSAPAVGAPSDVTLVVEGRDAAGNLTRVTRTLQVSPRGSSDPPQVAIACPSPGAFLAPGTTMGVSVDAFHADGVERVDLFVGDDPVPVDYDFEAPYLLSLTVPADAVPGTTLEVKARARSYAAVTAEVAYSLPVISAVVLSVDATLAAGDLSLDGQSVVVAAGVLTVEGPHTFQNLAVLDGATLTHLPSGATQPQKLDLSVAEDLFVSCGGSVDVSGLGYPGGFTYSEGASPVHH
ncbi:MAG: hypothetical protein KDD47_08990, partial [Acidobacteria bacterium]|nr:hypothetical protein [Acidobacteriota bacterium]